MGNNSNTNRKLITYDEDFYPWEQRPDLKEGDAAYQHFCYYRDMHLPFEGNGSHLYKKRSKSEVAKHFGISHITVRRQSENYQWASRVQSYDLYIDRRRREHNEELALEMHTNHVKIAKTMMAKALRKFATVNEDDLTINDVTKLVELSERIERIARGESIEQPLRTSKMIAEIEAIKNAGDGSNVEIVDDIPDNVVDDIPDDADVQQEDAEPKGDGA